MQTTKKETNRLADEVSPYLLQHAHNPVDWYPWSEEAFEKAKEEDKPIFLSIGYSTCHWCHVMEEESFEDREVAKVLNQNFIAIKVDREERPDVDNIYMTVCQRMTGSGGWPLTIIMTPDKKPFFAGTYFPKNAKRGRPGLVSILEKIERLWQEQREELEKTGREMTELLQRQVGGEITEVSSEKFDRLLEHSFKSYQREFDEEYGGFGAAPKFPAPHNLLFLLRYWKLTEKEQALQMVEKTLDSMYQGGIYDHIGYGFARYSTDQKWLAPHFEKMLYDNALLTISYLEVYQATGKEDYVLIAREILEYVEREMTAPEGGFYSAQDADSEGEEGKFYLWSKKEITEVLGAELGEEFCQQYDITATGNFEGENIPNLIAKQVNKEELDNKFATAREKLFQARSERIPPGKDDKILTGWNGLMIAAMSMAARVLADDKYLELARQAVDFIKNNLHREDGRLLARYRNGNADYPAYAADYSYLIWGLIELYQSSFEVEYLELALELQEDLLEYFWDEKQGGLYLYGSDGEELIARPKEVYDGALPAANSVASLNFLRLARLSANEELLQKAEKQFQLFWQQIKNYPRGHAYFLTALIFSRAKQRELVLVVDKDNKKEREFIELVNEQFLPFTTVIVKDYQNETALAEIIPFITEYERIDEQATAYHCQNFTCHAPVTELEELREKLLVKS